MKKGEPSSVIHFTSLEAFYGMLQPWFESANKVKPYLNFHATVFNKMNDLDEGCLIYNKYFTDSALKKDIKIEFEKWRENTGLPFIISFMYNQRSPEDWQTNIPMWMNYGRHGVGICLRFSFKELKTFCQNKNLIFEKCTYHSTKEIQDTVSQFNKAHKGPNGGHLDFGYLQKQMILCKSKNWSYENEWRILKYVTEKDMKFKANSLNLIEYTNIRIPLKCLTGICVGYKLDFDSVQQSLKTILNIIKGRCGNDVEDLDKVRIVQSRLHIQ